MYEVGTVGKFSDYQPEGPGFNPRPGGGLNFGRPSFATPIVDRKVKLVNPVSRGSIGVLKRTQRIIDNK